MDDVKDRLANRVQLTTDGRRAYLNAVEEAFGADIDYAMLVKQYGEPESNKSPDRRYSPAVCTGAVKTRVEGNPDPEHVSTSHIERANLTMRMANRRFTRLTNAFSKKFDNHVHMIAIYTVWYNFLKMPPTLPIPPALSSGFSPPLLSLSFPFRSAFLLFSEAGPALPLQ
ncbi:hypothetical protein EOA86_33930, partial [Mesorhizobium sp. M5C.F.Ca.IN.020.32.2.1]